MWFNTTGRCEIPVEHYPQVAILDTTVEELQKMLQGTRAPSYGPPSLGALTG